MNESPAEPPLRSRLHVPPVGQGRASRIGALPAAWHANPARNFTAGALAAIVSLPLAMGLGALAVAPLGPAYAAAGVLAGLYGAAFLGLIAVLAGARGIAIYAPRSLVSFMIAAVCANVILPAPWLPKDDPRLVMAALFLMMAMAGLFQLLFGLLRLARLVKFIPTPVVAGFQNAASVIIMLSQLHVLLGISERPALLDWPSALLELKPLGAAVGIGTLALVFLGPRITKRVPPLLLGLLAGTVAHYVLALAGLGAHLGGTLGLIPAAMPSGEEFAHVLVLATLPGFAEALPGLAVAAFSIALVASLDLLISAKAVETLSSIRGNSTRELLCIGTANTVTPLLGGLAGAISLAPSIANYRGGARSSLSLFTHGALFLVLVPLAAPALGFIPKAVIAALVVHAGTQLFDRWTLQLLGRIFHRQTVNWDVIAVDVMVIAIVSGIALAGHVVAAVVVGVGIAIAMFTFRMSRGVIRSARHGHEVHSRRTWDAASIAVLAKNGRRILALELEGPMFFASAENLYNRVEDEVLAGVRYVILDFSRVNELDSSGARILGQVLHGVRAAGARLVICGQDVHHQTGSMLADHDLDEALGAEHLFPDLDHALEWCEAHVLAAEALDHVAQGRALALHELDLCRGLTEAETRQLQDAVALKTYEDGAVVFSEGEPGDALYVIAHGAATVRLRAGEHPGPGIRLMTFSAGTLFGEMAILDHEARSATVVADGRLACYVLSREAFDRLVEAHPRIGMVMLANIGRELSFRMRRANRTLASRD